MWNWSIAALHNILDYGEKFLNSNFSTALFGSLAGAFAGAYTAQRIAERAKQKDDLLKEIRNTNAAIMIAGGITESYLGLKKQHVRNLHDNFFEQKTSLEAFKKKRDAGLIDPATVFEVKFDLETLTAISVPVDPIQTLIFDKMSLTGRALGLAATLVQTIHTLDSSIEHRNRWIESWKASPLSTEKMIPLYFGLKQGSRVDQTYLTSIQAIYSQTDDAIAFSKMLLDDLVQHGEQLKAQFVKNFRGTPPKINKIDFPKAEAEKLMPPPENYSDWTDRFVKQPT